MKTRVLALSPCLLLHCRPFLTTVHAVLDQDTVSWNREQQQLEGTGSISASYNTPTARQITSTSHQTLQTSRWATTTPKSTPSSTHGPDGCVWPDTPTSQQQEHQRRGSFPCTIFKRDLLCPNPNVRRSKQQFKLRLVDNTTACFTVARPSKVSDADISQRNCSMNTSVAPTVQANTTFSTRCQLRPHRQGRDLALHTKQRWSECEVPAIEWNGTGNGTFDTWNISGLSTGTYTFKVWLFYRLGSSGVTPLRNCTPQFHRFSSSGSGGNNNTGCGYNTTYFSMYVPALPGHDGDTLNATVSPTAPAQSPTAYYGFNSTTYLASGN